MSAHGCQHDGQKLAGDHCDDQCSCATHCSVTGHGVSLASSSCLVCPVSVASAAVSAIEAFFSSKPADLPDKPPRLTA